MKSNKEKIISTLKNRIESDFIKDKSATNVSDKQVAILLGELQIAQLELEMQNDELSLSAQMLETERAKFAGFFNLAPFGYFILDQYGIVTEANQIGLALLNINKRKISSQRFQSFVAPEYWEDFYAFLHKMKPSGQKQSIEVKLVLSNEKVMYTRMEGIAINNQFTQNLEYYVTVIDITDSRNAQQELRETNKRLELTLTASSTGTWTINLKDNRVFLDQFSLALLDVHTWDFDGSLKSFVQIIHPEDRDLVRHQLLNSADNTERIDVEFKVKHKNGEIRHMVAKGHQVKTDVPDLFFAGILIDVTERKKINEAAQELLHEKQKLILSTTFSAQEKERYRISSALHDSICQLLYGIRLNLHNIQVSNKVKNELKNVHQLLAQAIRETRELSYELTPSVLRDFGFVEGVREMAHRLSTSNFSIHTQINTGANLLDSDLQLSIFRIIQELLNNIIKHAQATMAEVFVCTEGGFASIVVNDNGVGFGLDQETAMINGSGLRGIKNRVFLLNGTINLNTSSNGTNVSIKFKI